FQRYVDDGVVVIAASNHYSARFLPMDVVAPALAAIIFGNGVTLPPAFSAFDKQLLEKYRGAYRLSSGAKLLVAVEHDKLMIGAEGQEAVDLLAVADAPSKKRLAEANDRTAELLKGIRTGDYGPVQRAFRITPEQAQQLAVNWLSSLENKQGSLKTFTV